jgi:hypothetical protein
LKRVGAIIIVLLLFYTQLGYYGQFMFLQWQMKEAARESWIAALPDRSFFVVRLSDVNETGKWEEAGKECWYKDHLYDVIRRKTIGDVVWLYCMDDEREEHLIRQSGEFTRATQDGPDKKTNHSLTIGMGDWLAQRVAFVFARPPLFRLTHFCYDRESLPTLYTEIIIPPPKV